MLDVIVLERPVRQPVEDGEDEAHDRHEQRETASCDDLHSGRMSDAAPRIRQYQPNGRRSFDWKYFVRNATEAYAVIAGEHAARERLERAPHAPLARTGAGLSSRRRRRSPGSRARTKTAPHPRARVHEQSRDDRRARARDARKQRERLRELRRRRRRAGAASRADVAAVRRRCARAATRPRT